MRSSAPDGRAATIAVLVDDPDTTLDRLACTSPAGDERVVRAGDLVVTGTAHNKS